MEEEPVGFAPTLFDSSSASDVLSFRKLLSGERPPLVKSDRLRSQIRELIKSRNPGQLDAAELDRAADVFLTTHGGEAYGTWVHYPWRRSVVRVLPVAEFVELRTSRNRYKITAEEQEKLGRATLGIVGLSAGNAIAMCLALERVGSRFRLADYDAIELSNMNRVGCGVPALGLNKAVLTARQLYEIDPYLDVVPFTDGITPENIDEFLGTTTKLDLLIEECDDLYMKVRLREEAKARGIPVVMETNDRGLLDVERFDLEPTRPVFHGLLEGTQSHELRNLDTEGKTPFVLRILGMDMSPRLAASLIEIDRSITGWPQLASGNMLGGAAVTDTARRLLLGHLASSGRYRVDLEGIIGAESIAIDLPSASVQPSAPAIVEPFGRIVSSPKSVPTRAEVEWVVRRAAMAPSGGNDQPWRFVWHRERMLDCYLDRTRSGSFLDYERSASCLALGAAAENAWLAATGLGREAELVSFPSSSDCDLLFRLILDAPSDSVRAAPLLSQVESRATNRRLAERKPLDSVRAETLREAARERGAELTLITDPGVLAEVGSLLGKVDRFRFHCARLHTSMMSELRWSEEEALRTGDGIDVATLELDHVGLAGLRLLSNEKTATFLRSLGQGTRLERPARRSVDAASAVGLLTIDGAGTHAHFNAGRAMQRVWLTATQLGLALQPMSVATYLFARLTRGSGEGFSSTEIRILNELRERFTSVFSTPGGRAEPMLFRLAVAPPPTARAIRRPVADILTQA